MSPTINNSHALSVKNSNPPVVIILARQEVAPAPSIGTNGCLMGGYRRQLLKGKILVPLVPLSSLFLICLRVKSIFGGASTGKWQANSIFPQGKDILVTMNVQ